MKTFKRAHGTCVSFGLLVISTLRLSAAITVEQWDTFEITLQGPSTGNPFVEVRFSARFTQGPTTIEVPGFYDGDGNYRVRFLAGRQGEWTYVTRSDRAALNGLEGTFTVSEPQAGNHGPVQVAHTFHFAYADGTPYRQVGTTCYAWTHQDEALQEQTLRTLERSPFNKVRFCVFPKRYAWNTNEPSRYPFEGAPAEFDFSRFNPSFFRHFERRILDLQRLGIEADLILFHPYDRGTWRFDRMTPEEDHRYIRYAVARFAAFRNVWWSLANEYDFMREKTEEDWSGSASAWLRATRSSISLESTMALRSSTIRSHGSLTRAFKTALPSRTPPAPCSTAMCSASQ
jgi:hypothetical protein